MTSDYDAKKQAQYRLVLETIIEQHWQIDALRIYLVSRDNAPYITHLGPPEVAVQRAIDLWDGDDTNAGKPKAREGDFTVTEILLLD